MKEANEVTKETLPANKKGDSFGKGIQNIYS